VHLKEKLLSPATLMLTSSLPLALLSPDQAPAAVQLVALVVDQVMVTEVLSATETEEDERLTVGIGVGVVVVVVEDVVEGAIAGAGISPPQAIKNDIIMMYIFFELIIVIINSKNC